MPRTAYDQALAHIKQALTLLKLSEPPPVPNNRKSAPAPDQWRDTFAQMKALRDAGFPYHAIADKLHAAGHVGRGGGRIFPSTVRQSLKAAAEAEAKLKAAMEGDVIEWFHLHLHTVAGSIVEFGEFYDRYLKATGSTASDRRLSKLLRQHGALVGNYTDNVVCIGNVSWNAATPASTPFYLTSTGRLKRRCTSNGHQNRKRKR